MPTTTEIIRPANRLDEKLSGFACAQCGVDDKPLIVFGQMYKGQTYWSPAYCSVPCHEEAVAG